MISMMKEPEDMTLIGPVIEKQQKIINDCVEKKLTLSKLQSTISTLLLAIAPQCSILCFTNSAF